jgi:hypothetical protein
MPHVIDYALVVFAPTGLDDVESQFVAEDFIPWLKMCRKKRVLKCLLVCNSMDALFDPSTHRIAREKNNSAPQINPGTDVVTSIWMDRLKLPNLGSESDGGLVSNGDAGSQVQIDGSDSRQSNQPVCDPTQDSALEFSLDEGQTKLEVSSDSKHEEDVFNYSLRG